MTNCFSPASPFANMSDIEKQPTAGPETTIKVASNESDELIRTSSHHHFDIVSTYCGLEVGELVQQRADVITVQTVARCRP